MTDNIEPGQPLKVSPELDILYTAINRLASAQTSAALLDAVSDYPRSCGAVAGTLLYFYNNTDSLPEWTEIDAEWGPSASTLGHRVSIAQSPVSELMACGSDAPLLIPDATVSDLLSPGTREAYRRAQVYGLAFLPLRIQSRWVGCVLFSWDTPQAFQEQDQRIFTAFACQVGLKADLMQGLEAERPHKALLAKVAQLTAAADSPDVDTLLETVVSLIKDSFALSHVNIYLLDTSGEALVLVAGSSPVAQQLIQSGHRIPLSLAQSPVAQAGHTRRKIIINDVTRAPEFVPDPLWQATLSEMAAPLIASDTLIGVLDVQADTVGQFTDVVSPVIATLADQIAIAGQNAYAYKHVLAAEQSLEDRAIFLQRLLDAIPNPIFYKDMQGHYQGFNVAFLDYYGKKREDVLNKSVYELNPKELADIYYAKDQEVFQNPGKIQVYESQVRYADGTIHQVIYSKAILINRDGSLWGLVGVITDITERRKAEEALRESEARYRTLFEFSLDSIFVHQQEVLVYVNPAGVKLLRAASQADLIGKSFLDFVHPDYRSVSQQRIRDISQDDQTATWLEEKIICLDGSIVDVEIGTSALTLGGKIHIQTIIRDITERKQMVSLLAQERALLRTLVDNLPDLVYIKDQDSRFMMINKVPHDQMTFSAEQIIGHTDFDLFPEEIAASFFEDEQAIIRTGQAVINQEEFVVTPGGDKMWVSTTKVPLRNSEGSIIGVVGITRDITSQRLVAEALEASEARLRLIMENSQEGIILTNEQSEVLMVNPAACRIFGRNESELLACKLSDLIDETETRFRRFFDEVKNTGYGQSELTGYRPDHTSFPIELSIGVFASQNGKEQLGSVSIRDISEHHRFQQTLIERGRLQMALTKEAELSQLKTRMMERIAHEFRTPLTIIGMSAESLDTHLDRLTTEQRATKIRNIHVQIRHFSKLLDQIGLAMEGNLVPDKVVLNPVDISELCRQTAHELEAQLVQPGKYTLDIPESVIVRADRAILRSALLHVMQNAAQYSTVPMQVTVSLSHKNQGVEIRVSDRGIGILMEDQARIFEAFFRGRNIGVVSGLGLGLTIARGCVELHQGTITVDSIPGQGTTVRIWLPHVTG